MTFSMTLALALILKYFQDFPCFGGIFWPYSIQQIQTVVSTKNACRLVTHLNLTLSILWHSTVTNSPNITFIFHDFPGPTIKFHDFSRPGKKNEVLKFYDFPGFSWLNPTNPAMCFFILLSDLPVTLQSRYKKCCLVSIGETSFTQKGHMWIKFAVTFSS